MKSRSTNTTIVGKNFAKHKQPSSQARLAIGYWISQSLAVATKLDIVAELKNGLRSIEELAAITYAHDAAFFRLVRVLARREVNNRGFRSI